MKCLLRVTAQAPAVWVLCSACMGRPCTWAVMGVGQSSCPSPEASWTVGLDPIISP